MGTYAGDVFITIVNSIVMNVYSNQYLADAAADEFNKAAIEKGCPSRMAVICRSFYTFQEKQ